MKEGIENQRKQASNPSSEGWVGHPLDPIGCLYSILTEVSSIAEETPAPKASTSERPARSSNQTNNNNAGSNNNSSNSQSSSSNEGSSSSRQFQHIPIPGSKDNQESYLSLAMEVCLMGLGQQRVMPTGVYPQEKAMKQEEALIACLSNLNMDSTLMSVLRKQAVLLLEGGPSSGLGLGIHTESVPMHTFAKYLFNRLYNYDIDLAFRVGLRAMR